MSDSADVFALAEGLRVLVTAGASGIGRAISDLLIARGARVHICDVSDDFLAEFRSAHRDSGATKADVASEADVSRLFAEVESSLGGLDVLVNNAGVAGPTGGVEDIRPEDWRRTIDVCLTGQFLCAHHAVPMLKSAGGGAIVNLSSAAGRFGYAFRTPYSAAKWGVIGFTHSLAKELGPDNIRVNAILPGIVEGPRMTGVIAARARQMERLLRSDGEDLPRSRVAAPHGVSRRRRRHGRLPSLAGRPQYFRPDDRSGRQCRSVVTASPQNRSLIGGSFEQSRRHRIGLRRARMGD